MGWTWTAVYNLTGQVHELLLPLELALQFRFPRFAPRLYVLIVPFRPQTVICPAICFVFTAILPHAHTAPVIQHFMQAAMKRFLQANLYDVRIVLTHQ
jgi:hypothetical protein